MSKENKTSLTFRLLSKLYLITDEEQTAIYTNNQINCIMANYKQMSIDEGKAETLKVRDERIDSVKYWLIVLVIAAHVLGGDFSKNPECAVIRKWLCMFLMPLFIFISGYFSRKKTGNLLTSLWKILEPLVIFHTIGIIAQILTKGSVSLSIILTPWYVLWYLLCLIYWRLLLQIIPNSLLNKTRLIVISTFCIGIVAGFLPFGKLFSLQRALSFMPFFFLGYCMRNKNLFLPKKYKIFYFLFFISFLIIPVFFPNILGNLNHSIPYRSNYDALCRIFAFAIAIPMSLAFINICPNKPWFSKQGRFTMQYYIYHALIIPLYLVIVDKYNLPTSSLFAALFYIMVITIGIGIASYLPYFNKFTNPSTFLIKQ